MNRIENPQADTAEPRPSTLRLLDEVLKWKPGSAAGCLELRDPVPLEDHVDSPSVGFDILDIAAEVTGGRDVASNLVDSRGLNSGDMQFDSISVPAEIFVQFFALSDQYRQEGDSERFGAGLDAITQQLGAVHATEVLEHAGGPGRTVPRYLHMSLRPYITPGATFQGPNGKRYYFADQDYRRWLAGLEDDTPDQRFRRRWIAKIRSAQPQR